MLSTSRLCACIALGIAALLTATGCAAQQTPPPSPSPTQTAWQPTGAAGTLRGAGPASSAGTVDTWNPALASAGNGDVALSFDDAESPVARTRFQGGVDQFAVSSRAFTEAERRGRLFRGCTRPETGPTPSPAAEGTPAPIVQVPVSVSTIAVVFRLNDVGYLHLDAATLAGIFSGLIESWDDPAIAATNPHVALPALPITVVHVGRPSGLTQNFTDYLSANTDSVWTSGAVESWPLRGGVAAADSADVADTVLAQDGSIGYAWAAEAGEAPIARIASYTTYAAPSATGALLTIAHSSLRHDVDGAGVTVVIDRTPDTAGSYPLVAVNYLIGCVDYADEQETAAFRALLWASVDAPPTDDRNLASLPESVTDETSLLLETLSGPRA